MPKLKILLLITQMEPAGAQKVLLSLARGLQKRQHSVTIVAMYDKGNFVPKFIEQYGVDIINLQMKSIQNKKIWQKIKSVIRGVYQLIKIMRNGKYDVVQTFSHYSNVFGPIIALISGIPLRVTSQRMSLKGAPKWLLFLDRVINNSFLVDKMVTVSEKTRLFCIEVEKIHPHKLTTIYNSVDINRFSKENLNPEYVTQLRNGLGLSESASIVIVIARLHPQKGHSFLIRAIPSIIKVIPDTHFLFVGEGELRLELMNQTRQLGVDKLVHFLGVRHDIPELLATSDIFVLPSLWEGLPNTVLEAMAMKIPVIASNVDGCIEIIQNEQTGLLVSPANPGELEIAIIRLLEIMTLRKMLANKAYIWVASNFTEEKFITSFEQLYANLVNARKLSL